MLRRDRRAGEEANGNDPYGIAAKDPDADCHEKQTDPQDHFVDALGVDYVTGEPDRLDTHFGEQTEYEQAQTGSMADFIQPAPGGEHPG